MRTGRRIRSGVVLLEALIALFMFGTAAMALLRVTQAIAIANRRSARAELEVIEANRLMETASLWPVADLTLRLGIRDQGQFNLNIERISPELFALSISNRSSKLLLRTVVYRRAAQ